jgi:transposase
MDIPQAKAAAREGRLSVELFEQVLDELERQAQTIRRLTADNERLRQRLAQYEPEIARETSPRHSTADDSPHHHYGLDAEEKRRQPRRRKKKSPGRRPTELKFADADRYQDVYPPDVRRADCELARERAVWRLEKGQALLVGYHIYRAPGGVEPRIPGVTPRCEYGLEILVVLAFLVYVIGISLDKTCAVLTFFCGLALTKSQADALLRQLAHHWEAEYDTLCDLIAHAAVVYMDETGWKIGSEGCSLWTFAAKLQRVFLFGCHKDAATLDTMLPPDLFEGIGVSDDAAVYRHRFARAQKCWAHLLRKAIKLALLYPREKSYRRFLDRLLALYYDAKRMAADQRLGEAGRQQRVADLEGRLCVLCEPYWHETTPAMKPHERDFANLVNELMQRLFDEELFTFVLEPEVEPTNNFTERLQRGPALERKAGRTSKTAAGAHRRSVIVSVLESLRANLEQFTLTSVLAEVQHWLDDGISLFGRQWQAATAPVPNTS